MIPGGDRAPSRPDPQLSVQRPNVPDLLTGRIATGALVGPSAVLVPDDQLGLVAVEAPAGLAVVLGPHDPVTTGGPDVSPVLWRQVVAIRPVTFTAAGGQGDPRRTAGLLALDHPVPFAGVARQGDLTALRDAWSDAQDTWAALEISGTLPAGLRTPPDADWLRHAADVAGGPPGTAPALDLPATEAIELGADWFCRMFPWLC